MPRALREFLSVDRGQLMLAAAARNTVGVVLPLVVGLATGHLYGGLTVAIGAQNVAMADRPGPYRLRLARLALTGAFAAVGAAAGILVGRVDVLAVLLTVCWAFAAGMLVSLGPAAKQVGVTSTVLMLVLAGRAQTVGVSGPTAALMAGLQILVGGALQALFAVSAWPLRRYRPERTALATAYAELATTAEQAPGTGTGPALTATIDSVHRTLRGLGRVRSEPVAPLHRLLDKAEHIRMELLALSAHAERLDALGAPSARERIVDVLDAAAALLHRISESLQSTEPPVNVPLAARSFASARESLADLARQAEAGSFQELVTLRAAAARASALDTQLRDAVGTVSTWPYERDADSGEGAPALPASLRPDNPLQTLRANLGPRSAAFRHAVRLAICLGVADTVVRVAGVPRGYWFPLTILLTLQPDFATTMSRGLLRIAGTLVGLGVVTGLIVVLPSSHVVDLILIAVLFFGFRVFFLASFGLSVVFLTALIVVLLSVVGVDPAATIAERGVYGAAGGLVALGTYLVWPTWERSRVRGTLADLLDAYGGYAALVAHREPDPGRLSSARSAARVARTNAEASIDRLHGDPGRTRDDDLVELADGVMDASVRFVHAAMRWEAARQDTGMTTVPASLAAFGEDVCDSLERMADAVRTGAAPAALPDLDEAAARVRAELTDEHGEPVGHNAAAYIESTDEIAQSLAALAKTVRGGVR
ncbi:MAG: FUSC family protein [Streptosporangiales bacterium]|nr:FUSC family protein [Streptosporangiales bacterium]MBO0890973.1 FUSC family protein [Acidothermales bacterium]